LTKFSQSWGEKSLTFTISPTEGKRNLVPPVRRYLLKFKGIIEPETATIFMNGAPMKVESSYLSATETLELVGITLSPTEELRVTLHGDLLNTRNRDFEKLEKYLFQFKLESWEKRKIYQDWERIASGDLSLLRYRHLTDAQRSVLGSLIKK